MCPLTFVFKYLIIFISFAKALEKGANDYPNRESNLLDYDIPVSPSLEVTHSVWASEIVYYTTTTLVPMHLPSETVFTTVEPKDFTPDKTAVEVHDPLDPSIYNPTEAVPEQPTNVHPDVQDMVFGWVKEYLNKTSDTTTKKIGIQDMTTTTDRHFTDEFHVTDINEVFNRSTNMSAQGRTNNSQPPNINPGQNFKQNPSFNPRLNPGTNAQGPRSYYNPHSYNPAFNQYGYAQGRPTHYPPYNPYQGQGRYGNLQQNYQYNQYQRMPGPGRYVPYHNPVANHSNSHNTTNYITNVPVNTKSPDSTWVSHGLPATNPLAYKLVPGKGMEKRHHFKYYYNHNHGSSTSEPIQHTTQDDFSVNYADYNNPAKATNDDMLRNKNERQGDDDSRHVEDFTIASTDRNKLWNVFGDKTTTETTTVTTTDTTTVTTTVTTQVTTTETTTTIKPEDTTSTTLATTTQSTSEIVTPDQTETTLQSTSEITPTPTEETTVPEVIETTKKPAIDMYDSIPGWYEVEFPDREVATIATTTTTETPLYPEVVTEGAVTEETTAPAIKVDVVLEAKQDMVKYKLGFLTGFLSKLLQIISLKDRDNDIELFVSLEEVIKEMESKGELASMGYPAGAALLTSASIIVSWDATQVQQEAAKGAILFQQEGLLDEELRQMFSSIDKTYSAQEGEALLQTLQEIYDFPQHNLTSKGVVSQMVECILSPYKRTVGTAYNTMFMENLNNILLDRFSFRRFNVQEESVKGKKRYLNRMQSSNKWNDANGRLQEMSTRKIFDRNSRHRYNISNAKTYNYDLNVIIDNKYIDSNKRSKIYNGYRSNLAGRNIYPKDNIPLLNDAGIERKRKGYKGLLNTDEKIKSMANPELSPRKMKTPLRTLTKHRIKQHLKQKHPEIYYEFKKRRAIKKKGERKGRKKPFQLKTKPKRLDRLKENDYTYENALKNRILNYIRKIDIEKIVRTKGENLSAETEDESTTMRTQKRFNIVTAPTTVKETDVQPNIFILAPDNNQEDIVIQKIPEHSEDNTKSKYLMPVQLILNKQEHRFRQMKSSEENNKRKKSKSKKSLLQNIVEESSYSDEEEELKWFLTDAMRHGDAVFKNYRRNNDIVKKEKRITDLSSYSDEEGVFKNNIYKAFGYNANLEAIKY